jgi:site-specific DNA-methyltransferase (adenine-specific)
MMKKKSSKESSRRRSWWKVVPNDYFYQYPRGDIICSDALHFLNDLKEGCADIVFLDPPFNLGKKYGISIPGADRVEESEYLEYMIKIISRSAEIIKPGGAFYLYQMPRWAIKLASVAESVLEFRHWIAISMKNGFARGKSLYPAHYSLLYFTKGAPAVFNRPKIPTPRCRHCNELIKDYGGYKKYVVNGINLSDVWDDISPVRHKRYKHRTANELPLEIPNRVVTISGINNGLLVDPFAGTGTAIIAAYQNGMNFVACDLAPENCRIILNRLQNPVNNSKRRN